MSDGLVRVARQMEQDVLSTDDITLKSQLMSELCANTMRFAERDLNLGQGEKR